MEAVKKEVNECGLDRFIIQTDQGKFELDLSENGDLYIGLYDKEHTGNEDVSFTIDRENLFLYNIIKKRYEEIISLKPLGLTEEDMGPIMEEYLSQRAPVDGTKVDWASDDMEKETASHMIIEKCEDTDAFIITFKKSKSPNVYNSYFVKVSKERSMYEPFNTSMFSLQADLKHYQDDRQISIEEYMIIVSKQQRVRTSIPTCSHK